MIDTYQLTKKDFKYAGSISTSEAMLSRYDSLISLDKLKAKPSDRQYCYADSEIAARAVVARLQAYSTIRVQQLAWNLWVLAWAKTAPKVRPQRALYMDIDRLGHNWGDLLCITVIA